jgi:hypothetical protein
MIPVLGRLRQEDQAFKASLNDTQSPKKNFFKPTHKNNTGELMDGFYLGVQKPWLKLHRGS